MTVSKKRPGTTPAAVLEHVQYNYDHSFASLIKNKSSNQHVINANDNLGRTATEVGVDLSSGVGINTMFHLVYHIMQIISNHMHWVFQIALLVLYITDSTTSSMHASGGRETFYAGNKASQHKTTHIVNLVYQINVL